MLCQLWTAVHWAACITILDMRGVILVCIPTDTAAPLHPGRVHLWPPECIPHSRKAHVS